MWHQRQVASLPWPDAARPLQPRIRPALVRRQRLRLAHPVRHSPLRKVEVHEMLRSCAERENVRPVGMAIVAGVYCSRSARHDNGEKAPDAIRMLRDDGWALVMTKGSHRQYRHPTKIGRVTVAGHGRDDLKPKTWNSILKQAGLRGGNS